MSEKKEQYGNFTFLEVARVSAIISDHIMTKLYEEVQSRGNGYMVTVEMIAEWAVEFAEKHTETSWEKVLEEGMKPLSDMKGIICWDDAVVDWSYFKLKEYKKS